MLGRTILWMSECVWMSFLFTPCVLCWCTEFYALLIFFSHQWELSVWWVVWRGWGWDWDWDWDFSHLWELSGWWAVWRGIGWDRARDSTCERGIHVAGQISKSHIPKEDYVEEDYRFWWCNCFLVRNFHNRYTKDVFVDSTRIILQSKLAYTN